MTFDQNVMDLPVEGIDNISGKKVQLGKVISQHWNTGIALIDIPKMDKLGGNAKYTIAGHRPMIWSPTWLDMIRAPMKDIINEEEIIE